MTDTVCPLESPLHGTKNEPPTGPLRAFRTHLRADFTAGFFVFLIALPLCLGIAAASGLPPLSGVLTAIVGGLVCPFLSNSETTVKGPAAGLIVVVFGCISDLGGDGISGGFSDADLLAYRGTLAVGLAAGVLQIIFGWLRGGVLAELFPRSVVHGMLAGIGVIIVLKQIPVVVGTEVSGEALEVIREAPHLLHEVNPAIALIGGLSLAVVFAWKPISERIRFLRALPAPLAVLCLALPLSFVFELSSPHEYTAFGASHAVGPQHLVLMPDRVFGIFEELVRPDFHALTKPIAWKWVVMFFLIGSIESLLSAKAADMLDRFGRRADLNRDMVAIGVGNTAASLLGGMPMISEIVRSRAGLDAGSRSRFTGFWHAVLLLVSAAMLPMVLDKIPLAALAALLVFTGCRLAQPREFTDAWKLGIGSFVVFVATLLGVLVIDLLAGVAIGIGVQIAVVMSSGVSLSGLFFARSETVKRDNGETVVSLLRPAVFTNWISVRRTLRSAFSDSPSHVRLDLSSAGFLDHTTRANLDELTVSMQAQGNTLILDGIESDKTHASCSRPD